MKVATFLPLFNGFYGTFFEYIIDDCESQAIEFYNEDNDTDLNYDDFRFAHKELMLEISKDCVEKVSEKLNDFGIDCEIKFEEIISPREYNFANDSINCEIIFKDFNQVLNLLKENEETFRDFIKDNYSSRSGFISFYSNDSDEWMEDLQTNPQDLKHQVGKCLGFILENVFEYTDRDLYEDISENGYIIEYSLADDTER